MSRCSLSLALAVLLISVPAWGQTGSGADRSEIPMRGGATGLQVRPQTVLALTRKEAIVRAITNNPDLQRAKLDVEIAFAGIDQAYAEFEPYGFLGGSYGKNRAPSFDIEIAPGVTFSGLPPGLQVNPQTFTNWNGGARIKTEVGTAFNLAYNYQRSSTENRFSLNPVITPSVSATVTQPLLRGLGLAVNRAFITIAAIGHETASETYKDQILTLALNVENAYWTLAATIENLKVAEQSLVTAKSLLRNVQDRLAAGTVAPIEVFSAEAGVASRQEQIISARNNVLNAQDQLLSLIVPSQALDAWDVSVTLLDAPRVQEATVDVPKAIEAAFASRPDLRALTLQIEAQSVQISRAENDRLPTLNAVGTWSQLGLGDGHHDSHEALFEGRFYNWSVGLEFEYPLFSIAPKAAIREAQARRRRARKQRDTLEQSVVLSVRTASRNLQSARERIRAAQYSVELAQRQLDAENDRLDNGTATNFDVLQKEEDLTAARVTEINARIDYVRAHAELGRAVGSLLEDHDIQVGR